MKNADTIVRKYIKGKILKTSDFDTDIFDDDVLAEAFAITSLKMIMLITSICEGENISLLNFDEDDIAGVKTVRDLAKLLGPHVEEKADG